ncbi:N/A [soil metagenome]
MDVTLRPFTRDDVAILQRFALDPDAAGIHNWTGFRNPNAAQERFDQDGLLSDEAGHLVIVADGATVGAVQWRPGAYDGLPAGNCWRIGCTVLPADRGRGIGTIAHRELVTYLLATTPAVRIEADTHADNVAERTCLRRAGFTEEGTLRSTAFRAGAWRDIVRYGLLRHDHDPDRVGAHTR